MNIDFPEPTSKSEGILKKMIHVIMQERELKKKRENKRIKHRNSCRLPFFSAQTSFEPDLCT